MNKDESQKIKILATKIRIDTVEAIQNIGAGHIGGSLSIIELLAVLYGKEMKYDPKNPSWKDRDRLVLSKGHAGVALYSTLAECGFFNKSELMTINRGGTSLPSHPDRSKTPGVDVTTGSLGQGTSIAAGIATGLKLDKKNNYVYLIVGDGELNEGQCWEAFQYIAHFKLNNCVVIIDENKKQLDGPNKEIINPFSIEEKMKAFGFDTITAKGHDIEAIDEALKFCHKVKDKAVCIILDSIKGQGISFFEEMNDNHSVKFDRKEIKDKTTEELMSLKKTIGEGE